MTAIDFLDVYIISLTLLHLQCLLATHLIGMTPLSQMRKWRKSRSDEDRLSYVIANKDVISQITKAKQSFFTEKLTGANNKTVFQTVNRLLNNESKPLPAYDSPKELCDKFAKFFINKILKIRQGIESSLSVSSPHPSPSPSCPSASSFTEFSCVTEDDLQRVISRSSNASCQLDPEPTWLLKEHLESHLTALTLVVNHSLTSGIFPVNAHSAMISPLLKKPSLDKEDLKNYRPVSNLKYSAKQIEKCAAQQFVDYLDSNNLMDPLQSAYRPMHCTETALLKVQQDIVSEIASKKVVLIVLLDMSAAFYTVDHSILCQRLMNCFGVNGTAIGWFASYLKGWKSQVNIAGVLSEPIQADFGLPQGSVLGPLLFTAYTLPMGNIIQKYSICYHLYADECQLYVPFDPQVPGDLENTLARLTACISDIRKWLSENYLKLNDSKTEFFIAGSWYNINKLPDISLKIGSHSIPISRTIRNLGIIFDQTMTLSQHVDSLRRSVTYHIRNLWRIRRFIDTESCHAAARALITSRLDYCNAIFTLLSSSDVKRLQRLQNSAARLVFAVGRKVDASSLLEKLHWLPVKKRIIFFKVLLYVYKALNNSAPSYLSQCFTLYHPSRQLRSSEDKTLLCIPRELTAIGRKNFNITAAYAWNELPKNIRLAPSTAAFKRLLKTHLFWYVCFCIHVSLLCFVYDFVSAVVLTWIAHLNALLLLYYYLLLIKTESAIFFLSFCFNYHLEMRQF